MNCYPCHKLLFPEMSFNSIETTWEPTPAYAIIPDHDVLEEDPPYIPTPSPDEMNTTIPGKVNQCIYNIKGLQSSLSALTLTKLHLLTPLSDTLMLLHDVRPALQPSDICEAYHAIKPADNDPTIESDTCDSEQPINDQTNTGTTFSSSDNDDVLPDLTSDTDTDADVPDLIGGTCSDISDYVHNDKPEMNVSPISLTNPSVNSSPQSPQPASIATPNPLDDADLPAEFDPMIK